MRISTSKIAVGRPVTPARVVPELVATGPGQVFSWDITKLAGPVMGKYFECYVMIDIYFRNVVGASVRAAESGVLAVEMVTNIFGIHGVARVVHADCGTSMTSEIVAALLADLEVTRSHSRPRVSNDNPYSESWFETLKYAPVFPERFASLGQVPLRSSGDRSRREPALVLGQLRSQDPRPARHDLEQQTPGDHRTQPPN